MKVGIIIHSQTGNTKHVAEKLKEKLMKEGHSVDLELLAAENEKERDAAKVLLKRIPDINVYDQVIFGGPVHGASVSPVLAAFLTQISTLKCKKVACFVTEAFPYPWMGGNRAIGQMKKICESKQGTVSKTGIVNWKNARREEMIANVINELSVL